MIEFVPTPDRGRTFTLELPVRLSDTGPDGLLRLDGIARYLQDVATDDWDSTGIVSDDTWVVRRTALRSVLTGRWPVLKDKVALTTWCGGAGAAWAERRTDLYVDDELLVQSVALWVPIDPQGHPVRVRPSFFDVYGEAMQGRKVSGRVSVTAPPPGTESTPWPLRRSDLDVVGHVNNAAVWQAVSEVVSGPVASVEVIHHGPVEGGNDVRLVRGEGSMWLLVGDEVRVAAHYSV
ncbi:MAG: acyl-[acyl-carrier-protein] thioesterase [Acidimicrobiales bacterium]